MESGQGAGAGDDEIEVPEDLPPELIDVLPPEFARDPQTLAIVRAVLASYSGPLPPPSMLEGYDRVLPGAAHRIIAMTEREQGHRHAEDRRFSNIRFWGLAAGFVCAMSSLIVAAVLAFYDKNVVAVSVVLAEATVIVGILVLRRLLPLRGGNANNSRT